MGTRGCGRQLHHTTHLATTEEIISDWSSKMLDGPITSVKFFTSASNPAAAQSRKVAGRYGAVGPSHMMHTHTYTYVHTSTYTCTCTHT